MSGDEISSEDVELLTELIFESGRLNSVESEGTARLILAALAGRLLPAGGSQRQIWRARNLHSDGAAIGWTREYAERFMDPGHVLETAIQTTFADGSVLTSAWNEVEQ